MCCFTQPVRSVMDTRIFARALADGRQALVYAMSFEADADLAMVLPIPTPVRAPEHALEFVDLSGYEDFFDDLQRGFPPPAYMGGLSLPVEQTLEVHRVGAFEASFVPHPDDFARLDPRFRLPTSLLDAQTTYRDWGFAVFKLHGGADHDDVHPMAFTFPRRDPTRLFFPTVHVHDGTVPSTAKFDHALYAQFSGPAPEGWWSTGIPAAKHVDLHRARGLVAPDHYVATSSLYGERPNVDHWV